MNEKMLVSKWQYGNNNDATVVETVAYEPQAETENLSAELYTVEDADGNYVAFLTRMADGIQYEVQIPFTLVKTLMQHILHEEVLKSVTQPAATCKKAN